MHFYFIFYFFIIHLSHYYCSDIDSLEDLGRINDLVKCDYANLKEGVSNQRFLHSDLRKALGVLDIISGKEKCNTYKEGGMSLWQVSKLNNFNKLSGESTIDEEFTKLFIDTKDVELKRNCVYKAIKTVDLAEWTKDEAILDFNSAERILTDSDMRRDDNKISFLYYASYNDQNLELALKSFMPKIDDDLLKKNLFLINYNYIPFLARFVFQNWSEKNNAIEIFKTTSNKIFDMFLGFDFDSKKRDSLINKYTASQLAINPEPRWIIEEKKTLHEEIVEVYNSVFNNMFPDMAQNAFFHGTYAKNAAFCEDYKSIIKEDNNIVKIIAFHQMINKLIVFFEQINSYEQYTNKEFIFMSHEDKVSWIEKFLQLDADTVLQDSYMIEMYFDYLKDAGEFDILCTIDKNELVIEALCFYFSNEEKSLDRLKSFVTSMMQAIKSSPNGGVLEKDLLLTCVKKLEKEKSFEVTLSTIKNHLVGAYGLSNSDGLKLLSDVLALECDVFAMIKSYGKGGGDFVEIEKKFNSYYSLWHRIIFYFFASYKKSLADFDINKFKKYIADKIIIDLPACIKKNIEEVYQCNRFYMSMERVLDHYEGIFGFFNGDKKKQYFTEIQLMFLYSLFTLIKSTEKDCPYYSYFQCDVATIKEILRVLPHENKKEFLRRMVLYLGECERRNEGDICYTKDLVGLLALMTDLKDVHDIIQSMQWTNEGKKLVSILYGNLLRNQYLKKEDYSVIATEDVCKLIIEDNYHFLLDYYCQNFDFIADDIKKEIVNHCNGLDQIEESDIKHIVDQIWERILLSNGGSRYVPNHSVAKLKEAQNSAYEGISGQVINSTVVHNRIDNDDRRIAQEKKIIEHLLYNVINVLVKYKKEEKNEISPFFIEFLRQCEKNNEAKDYYKYFSVFFAKDRFRGYHSQDFSNVMGFFLNQDLYEYLSLFLSLYSKQEGESEEAGDANISFKHEVIRYLLSQKNSAILNDFFKDDIYITFDWFITYYKYLEDDIVCLSSIEALWIKLLQSPCKTDAHKKLFLNIFATRLQQDLINEKISAEKIRENVELLNKSSMPAEDRQWFKENLIGNILEKKYYALLDVFLQDNTYITMDFFLKYYIAKEIKVSFFDLVDLDRGWEHLIKLFPTMTVEEKKTIMPIMADGLLKKICRDFDSEKNSIENDPNNISTFYEKFFPHDWPQEDKKSLLESVLDDLVLRRPDFIKLSECLITQLFFLDLLYKKIIKGSTLPDERRLNDTLGGLNTIYYSLSTKDKLQEHIAKMLTLCSLGVNQNPFCFYTEQIKILSEAMQIDINNQEGLLSDDQKKHYARLLKNIASQSVDAYEAVFYKRLFQMPSEEEKSVVMNKDLSCLSRSINDDDFADMIVSNIGHVLKWINRQDSISDIEWNYDGKICSEKDRDFIQLCIHLILYNGRFNDSKEECGRFYAKLNTLLDTYKESGLRENRSLRYNLLNNPSDYKGLNKVFLYGKSDIEYSLNIQDSQGVLFCCINQIYFDKSGDTNKIIPSPYKDALMMFESTQERGINKEKFLLDYYSRHFEFITQEIKNIILENLGFEASLDEQGVKKLSDKIWEKILEHNHGKKYNKDFIIKPHYPYYNALVKQIKTKAQEKKIIEHLIYNVINVLSEYNKTERGGFFIFFDELFNRCKDTIDYYKYFSLFLPKRNNQELVSKKSINDVVNTFLNNKLDKDKIKDYIQLFLSLNNYIQWYEIEDIFCYKDLSGILNELIKERLYIDLIWFFTVYKYNNKEHLECLINLDALWEFFLSENRDASGKTAVEIIIEGKEIFFIDFLCKKLCIDYKKNNLDRCKLASYLQSLTFNNLLKKNKSVKKGIIDFILSEKCYGILGLFFTESSYITEEYLLWDYNYTQLDRDATSFLVGLEIFYGCLKAKFKFMEPQEKKIWVVDLCKKIYTDCLAGKSDGFKRSEEIYKKALDDISLDNKSMERIIIHCDKLLEYQARQSRQSIDDPEKAFKEIIFDFILYNFYYGVLNEFCIGDTYITFDDVVDFCMGGKNWGIVGRLEKHIVGLVKLDNFFEYLKNSVSNMTEDRKKFFAVFICEKALQDFQGERLVEARRDDYLDLLKIYCDDVETKNTVMSFILSQGYYDLLDIFLKSDKYITCNFLYDYFINNGYYAIDSNKLLALDVFFNYVKKQLPEEQSNKKKTIVRYLCERMCADWKKGLKNNQLDNSSMQNNVNFLNSLYTDEEDLKEIKNIFMDCVLSKDYYDLLPAFFEHSIYITFDDVVDFCIGGKNSGIVGRLEKHIEQVVQLDNFFEYLKNSVSNMTEDHKKFFAVFICEKAFRDFKYKKLDEQRKNYYLDLLKTHCVDLKIKNTVMSFILSKEYYDLLDLFFEENDYITFNIFINYCIDNKKYLYSLAQQDNFWNRVKKSVAKIEEKNQSFFMAVICERLYSDCINKELSGEKVAEKVAENIALLKSLPITQEKYNDFKVQLIEYILKNGDYDLLYTFFTDNSYITADFFLKCCFDKDITISIYHLVGSDVFWDCLIKSFPDMTEEKQKKMVVKALWYKIYSECKINNVLIEEEPNQVSTFYEKFVPCDWPQKDKDSLLGFLLDELTIGSCGNDLSKCWITQLVFLDLLYKKIIQGSQLPNKDTLNEVLKLLNKQGSFRQRRDSLENYMARSLALCCIGVNNTDSYDYKTQLILLSDVLQTDINNQHGFLSYDKKKHYARLLKNIASRSVAAFSTIFKKSFLQMPSAEEKKDIRTPFKFSYLLASINNDDFADMIVSNIGHVLEWIKEQKNINGFDFQYKSKIDSEKDRDFIQLCINLILSNDRFNDSKEDSGLFYKKLNILLDKYKKTQCFASMHR